MNPVVCFISAFVLLLSALTSVSESHIHAIVALVMSLVFIGLGLWELWLEDR